MKILIKWIILFSSLSILLFLYLNSITKISDNNKNVKVETFETNVGWGFDIYINGKKLISQNHIPSVDGIHPFKTEKDAKNVGLLMKLKIENNNMPPSISIKELDSLNIYITPYEKN